MNKLRVLLLDGRSGAGKTSLASGLCAELEERGIEYGRFNLEDVYADWEGLEEGIRVLSEEIAPALSTGKTAFFRPWDWEKTQPSEKVLHLDPRPLLIVEGVGASSRSVRESFERHGAECVSVWIHAEAERRRQRALARDGESFIPYWDQWAGREEAWLEGSNAPATPEISATPELSATHLALLWALCLSHPGELGAVIRTPWSAASACPSTLPSLPNTENLNGGQLVDLLAEGYEHAAWLDSSMPEPSERNERSAIALGHVGISYANHQFTAYAPGAHARWDSAFFDWLSTHWEEPTTSPSRADAQGIEWIVQLGYELRSECGSEHSWHADPLNPAEADARLFWPELLAEHNGSEWKFFHRDASLHYGVSLHRGLSSAAPASAAQHTLSPPGGHSASNPALPSAFSPRDSRQQYLEKIRRCFEYIRAGSSYELCLTTELQAPYPAPASSSSSEPKDLRSYSLPLYEKLREHSPAPFSAYLSMFRGRPEQWALASTSPERFVRIESSGKILAEPIKGTRPRGKTPQEDARLLTELSTSAKDRAENIMIVDLLRNDLGAASVPGSVEVARLCDIERYANLFQMVSTITAHLHPGVPRAAALQAAFPPGSMTGCPKISSMDLLDALEQRRRSAYSGAVGYLGSDGSADLNVVIRSLEFSGENIRLGLGGAITIASDPMDEWEEVVAKSSGVLGALGLAFPNP